MTEKADATQNQHIFSHPKLLSCKLTTPDRLFMNKTQRKKHKTQNGKGKY